MEIARVRIQGQSKIVGIRKASNIKSGDYVKIIKIKNKDEGSLFEREKPSPVPVEVPNDNNS